MNRIALLHANLFYTIILVTTLLAGWALLAAIRGRGLGERSRALLWVAALLVAAEGLLGLLLLISGYWPPRAMHVVYGALAAVSLPLALGAADRPHQRSSRILAATCLWLIALVIRAWQTGA